MNHLPSAHRCLTATTLARMGVGVVALTLAWTATARAQSAPATAAAPVAPASAPLPPGVKIGAAQIPVVGGNSAGARERALEEALRQAVDQSLAEILDPQARATQAKAIRTLLQRSRPYIKRYRTLEEGEVNGSYGIRVEAEIDEPALRRATERWSAAPAPTTTTTTVRAAAPSVLVVGSGIPEATAALATALAGAGVRANLGEPSAASDPARALQLAARGGAGAVAFVSATLTDEGTVRGPGKEAVSCRLNARLVAAPGGQLLNDHSAQPRVFADRPEVARSECVARAAAEVAAHLVPAGSAATSAGADLKAITIDAGVSEPAALPALIKALRGLGSVSSAELRRLVAGRAEVRVQTRLLPQALLASLLREGAAVLELSSAEAGADSIRLQARLRPNLPPAAPPIPGPPGTIQ